LAEQLTLNQVEGVFKDSRGGNNVHYVQILGEKQLVLSIVSIVSRLFAPELHPNSVMSTQKGGSIFPSHDCKFFHRQLFSRGLLLVSIIPVLIEKPLLKLWKYVPKWLATHTGKAGTFLLVTALIMFIFTEPI
jgi:hypothetical protein